MYQIIYLSFISDLLCPPFFVFVCLVACYSICFFVCFHCRLLCSYGQFVLVSLKQKKFGKLVQDPHPQLPSFSSALEVKYSESRGRYAVASRYILLRSSTLRPVYFSFSLSHTLSLYLPQGRIQGGGQQAIRNGIGMEQWNSFFIYKYI